MPTQRADVTYLHVLKDISIQMQERRKNAVPSVIQLNWMIRSFIRNAQIEAWNMQEACYSLPICWCRNPESTCTNNFYNQQKWKTVRKKRFMNAEQWRGVEGSYLSLIRPIAALSRALGTLGSRNAVIEAPSGEKKTRRTELQLLDGSRFSVFLFSIIGLKTNIHYTLHYLSSSYSWSQKSTFLNNYYLRVFNI